MRSSYFGRFRLRETDAAVGLRSRMLIGRLEAVSQFSQERALR